MASRVALTLASLIVPSALWAHPGHGLDPSGTSLLHWLGEPEHALPLLAVALLATVWRVAALSRRSH